VIITLAWRATLNFQPAQPKKTVSYPKHCIASIFVGTSNGRFELLVNGRNESTEALGEPTALGRFQPPAAGRNRPILLKSRPWFPRQKSKRLKLKSLQPSMVNARCSKQFSG
jgi:hypothetical protein